MCIFLKAHEPNNKAVAIKLSQVSGSGRAPPLPETGTGGKDRMKSGHCLTCGVTKVPFSYLLLPKPKSVCTACAYPTMKASDILTLFKGGPHLARSQRKLPINWTWSNEDLCSLVQRFTEEYSFVKCPFTHSLFTRGENSTLMWN